MINVSFGNDSPMIVPHKVQRAVKMVVVVVVYNVLYYCHRKPVPGSEHVSPVASSVAYPPSMDVDSAAAAAAASEDLQTTDGDEITGGNVEVPEPVTEMDASDKEQLASTDVLSDVDSMEQPVTDKPGTVSLTLHHTTLIVSLTPSSQCSS